jgi:hypothetical protein
LIAHFFSLLFLLFVGHALCDYPLQGDFLAKGKNQHAPLPGVPWYQCMFAHSLIHAGMVGLVTGSLTLAILELILHFGIDFWKCEGALSFNKDQAAHFACKVFWAATIAAVQHV